MKMNVQHTAPRIRLLSGLFLLALAAALISSCGGKADSTDPSDTTKRVAKNSLTPCDSAQYLEVDTSIVGKKSFIYPLHPSAAAQVMASYLAKTPLYDLATEFSYGGEFPASMFNVPADGGLLMWFCYDKPTNQFFLAIESYIKKKYKDNMQAGTLPALAQTNKLNKPIHRFKYPKTSQSDPYTLENLINTHKEIVGTALVPADSISINKFIKSFRTISGPYVKYGFSYITENDEGDLARFVASAGPNGYVRYYFGYEEIDPIRGRIVPNKIRVVLTTVDATGKSRVGVFGPGSVIQSSWPPPPWDN